MTSSFLNLVFKQLYFVPIDLLEQKVRKIQEKRGKIERKRRWRGGDARLKQPNQRPLQVRLSGKMLRPGWIIPLSSTKNQMRPFSEA
jgi:hypothetical protein